MTAEKREHKKGFSVQAHGGRVGWKTVGVCFLWDDAVKLAKKLSRMKHDDGAPMPARIRFSRKTLSFYERGKSVAPITHTLRIWPDGSREWDRQTWGAALTRVAGVA